MVHEDIKNRIRVLYKEINKPENNDEQECQDNIDILEGLKVDLSSKGLINNWDFDRIYLGGFFGLQEKNIEKVNKEILRQLKKIARGLGIDLEENTKLPEKHSPQTIINLQQEQYQHQNQNQEMKIEFLKKELEEELSKENPDESKVKKAIDGIINVAKASAPAIISGVILKVLGG